MSGAVMSTGLVRWGKVPAAVARVNWGRWIADCSMCTSALAVVPGTPGFVCWDCGAHVEVVWPSTRMQAGVERLLALRPDPNTRNWQVGETLADLLAENVEHGLLTAAALEAARDGRPFAIEVLGERVVRDLLPATPPELITAATARQIGA